MKIVKPLTITDSILVSSNVPENDYSEWTAGTTYAVGSRVIVLSDHTQYESSSDGNQGNDPETDTVNWFSLGATNRWKAFDKKISNQVTNPTSIQYTLRDPATVIDSVIFFGLDASSVTVQVLKSDGTEVFNKTTSLVETDVVLDWYTYFFTAVTTSAEALVLNIPPYFNATVNITIDTTSGSDAKVGQIVVGSLNNLGLTTYGTSISIEDFSTKEVDTFGNFIVTKRAFSQVADYNISYPTVNARRIQSVLAQLRAEPVVYIGSDDTSFGLVLYGFYRRFDLTLETPSYSFGSIEIEGLT